mmetsp:Transcript_30851/g.59567  ORF Transcript_30851/g.59567 Transcript_30851/m.59567 type:complete len:215 (+) Transcript_30851:429-1073(+)
MRGIFSRSFWVTATRTVMTAAAGPPSITLTIGPSISLSANSPPPVPTRYGRISSRTFSTFSLVRSKPVSSSMTCSTSITSGIFSMTRRSMPIFMVVMEEGHEPHAPCKRRRTTSPSISTNSTLPPSAIRYGRTSSRTFSTFSSVNSRPCAAGVSAAARVTTLACDEWRAWCLEIRKLVCTRRAWESRETAERRVMHEAGRCAIGLRAATREFEA